MHNIDWGNIKLLIFDVDGTLYDQQGLRRRMFLSLFRHYLIRPHKLPELSILKACRTEREKNKDKHVNDLESAQYEWCSNKTGESTELIKAIVS